MDIKAFLSSYKSYDELASTISQIASDETENSIQLLSDFIRFKDPDTQGKHYTPKIASIALLNKGRDGIDKLVELLNEIDGYIYSKSILECLWYASNNLLTHYINFFRLKIYDPIEGELDSDSVIYARDAFYDVIISSRNNGLLLKLVENNQVQIEYLASKGIYIDMIGDVFSTLHDLSYKISNLLIKKFSMLIDMEQSEENYQIFFKENPVLINPTAFRIYDKHKLGDDLITDFVVETLKNDYYVVEIEKPQDNIFNKSGDFSQKFTHAFGQVLGFIDWIESNIAYAQRKLPDIISPKGLLIMGRSKDMSDIELRKLKRFNKNSNSIEVLTYDDVLLKANNLYKNIRSIS